MTVALCDLPPRTRARVVSLAAPAGVRHRLMEMGFVAGAELEVVRRGVPSLVRIHGGRVTLSHELARTILVHP